MPTSGGFEHRVPTHASVTMLDHSAVPQLTRTTGTGYSAVVVLLITFAMQPSVSRADDELLVSIG
jgi:hypothetical protein